MDHKIPSRRFNLGTLRWKACAHEERLNSCSSLRFGTLALKAKGHSG